MRRLGPLAACAASHGSKEAMAVEFSRTSAATRSRASADLLDRVSTAVSGRMFRFHLSIFESRRCPAEGMGISVVAGLFLRADGHLRRHNFGDLAWCHRSLSPAQ